MKKQYIKRITPNEGQTEALKLMKKFNKCKTSKEFCLDGSGGTGKTTIIKELFIKAEKNNPENYYVQKSVIGVTVSHKARMVLNNSLPNCITYAAAVNMSIEFDPWGEMIFVPKGNEFKLSKLYNYKYIVFDEASMVSEEMRQVLHMSCAPGSKIIYLGDHCQLPPIKPKNGNYDPNMDSSVFDLADKYTLTQKMRQTEGDHIATLCDTIREHIDGDQDLSWIPNLKRQFDPQANKGYSFSNDQAVVKSFVKNYKDGVDCRITAYRNKRIDQLNFWIRRDLFGPKSSETYTIGDLVVGNDLYNPGNDNEPIFFNGEDMIVKSIGESYVNDICCYELWMEDKTRPVFVVKEEDMPKYNKEIARLKAEAKRTNSWFEYMGFKSAYASINYGYAVSLYKIQGTTLTGAYVDLSDIMGVKPLSDKRKLQSFYVGCSRPTNFLAMF